MFQELMPLLAQRILLLTLSRVSDEQICVNVIPKSLKSDQRDDDSALTTPLGVTGTPKELDEQLPSQLLEFVETHLGLSSNLKSARVRKSRWTLPPKRREKQPRSQRTQNPTVNRARARVQPPRVRSQELRLTRTRMTRNRVPSQLRCLLPQFDLWDLRRVRATCSMWNRRTAAETCVQRSKLRSFMSLSRPCHHLNQKISF
jgi:PRTRC genetic system protein E